MGDVAGTVHLTIICDRIDVEMKGDCIMKNNQQEKKNRSGLYGKGKVSSAWCYRIPAIMIGVFGGSIVLVMIQSVLTLSGSASLQPPLQALLLCSWVIGIAWFANSRFHALWLQNNAMDLSAEQS